MKKSNWVAFVPFYLLIMILTIGAAGLGNQIVTVANQRFPVHWGHRVVIDAGHGGVDGGATSCTGVLESQINLQFALRLEAILQLLGHDTVMIRTEDISIYTTGDSIAAKKVSDLKERVRIVNETEGAILVSLHQNTFPDGRYSGAQVFYSDAGGSKLLASALQKSLNSGLGTVSKRTSKRANGIYLMDHIECTGVLVECGFLSNAAEEAKLRDPMYQNRLCAVIACTLSQYTKQLTSS